MPRKAARDLVREKLTLLLRRAEIRRREIGERSAESGSGDERFGDPGTIDRQWLQIHSCSGFGTYSESERSGRRVLCLSVPRGWNTEKTRSESWRKPVVEYEKHPVLGRW